MISLILDNYQSDPFQWNINHVAVINIGPILNIIFGIHQNEFIAFFNQEYNGNLEEMVDDDIKIVKGNCKEIEIKTRITKNNIFIGFRHLIVWGIEKNKNNNNDHQTNQSSISIEDRFCNIHIEEDMHKSCVFPLTNISSKRKEKNNHNEIIYCYQIETGFLFFIWLQCMAFHGKVKFYNHTEKRTENINHFFISFDDRNCNIYIALKKKTIENNRIFSTKQIKRINIWSEDDFLKSCFN